jgi:hypothetical protein
VGAIAEDFRLARSSRSISSDGGRRQQGRIQGGGVGGVRPGTFLGRVGLGLLAWVGRWRRRVYRVVVGYVIRSWPTTVNLDFFLKVLFFLRPFWYFLLVGYVFKEQNLSFSSIELFLRRAEKAYFYGANETQLGQIASTQQARRSSTPRPSGR